LRTAQQYLDRIIGNAEDGQFEHLDENVKRLQAAANHPHFPKQRAKLFINMARQAAAQAHIRAAQLFLEAISDASISGDRVAKQDSINNARLHASRAIKAGANPAINDHLNKIIGIMEQTTKPGIDAATKAEAARRTSVSAEWINGKPDKRKAIRFSSPRLSVLIDGVEAYTADWSMYGLRILQVPGCHQVGQRVRFRLRCVGLDEQTELLIATVVRHDPANQTLCVEFPAISTNILRIAKRIKSLGIPMERT
jgi:hypothetical protein